MSDRKEQRSLCSDADANRTANALQETILHTSDATREDLEQLLKEAQPVRSQTAPIVEECRGLAERLRSATYIKRLASLQASDSDDAPRQMGQFDLLEQIGNGGMGQVWKARHRRLGKIQAVKVIHPHRTNSAEVLQRFHREMQAIGQLEHQNIVAAQHADEIDGTPFLVMEYVDGKSLSEISKEHQQADRSIAIGSACEWIRQAALGIEYAHQRNVIHRDIKPGNIMLDRLGTIKVLDLGLARFTNSVSFDETLTQMHQAVGTPDYMAPEQLVESRAIDHKADVYALGATLYYLLSGRVCFPTEQSAPILQKAMKIAQEPPPRISDSRDDVPEALEELLSSCLAKDPDHRPQSAQQLADLLEPFANVQKEIDRPNEAALLQTKPFRWKAMPLVLMATAACALVISLGGFVLRLNDPVSGQLTIDAPDGVKIRATKINNPSETYVFSAEDDHSSLAIGTWKITIEGQGFDELIVEDGGLIEIKDRRGATVRITRSIARTGDQRLVDWYLNLPDVDPATGKKTSLYDRGFGVWIESDGQPFQLDKLPELPEEFRVTRVSMRIEHSDELSVLRDLEHLRILHLHAGQSAVTEGWSLADIPMSSLVELSLGAVSSRTAHFTPETIRSLDESTTLQHLKLADDSSNLLPLYVEKFPELESLSGRGDLTEREARILCELTQLKEFHYSYGTATNETFEVLSNHPTLRRIQLSVYKVEEEGLAHLANMRNLESLKIPHSNVTGNFLSAFRSHSLQSLDPGLVSNREACVEHLSAMQLTEITLRGPLWTLDDFLQLARLGTVSHLILIASHTSLNPTDQDELQSLPGVSFTIGDSAPIGGQVAAHLLEAKVQVQAVDSNNSRAFIKSLRDVLELGQYHDFKLLRLDVSASDITPAELMSPVDRLDYLLERLTLKHDQWSTEQLQQTGLNSRFAEILRLDAPRSMSTE